MATMLMNPVEWWHLIARFVTSLPGSPPSVANEIWADDHLTKGERSLWVQLSNQDRRHSIAVAQRFVEDRPDATVPEIAGALLHDVGKIIGPRGKRFAAYHDHEAIGAEMANNVGSEAATIELIAGSGPAIKSLNRSDHA
jgi:HD superfamily phosphodiesterase